MNAEPLRVLYVHHTPMLGGAEGSLLCLLRHLPDDLVSPSLACPPGGLLERPGAAGNADLYPLPAWHPRLSLTSWAAKAQMQHLATMAAAISGLARETGAELIHANSWPCALAAVSDRGHRLPVLWHVRDLQIRRPVTWWLRGRCSGQIAISHAVRDFLHQRGFSPERVHVVYNGIDTTELAPARDAENVRREFGVPPGAPLVVSVAQLVPWKRHDLLLQAARLILERFPTARFLLVGGDPAPRASRLEQLRSEARQMGLEHALTLAGYRADAADLVSAADVFYHAADAEPLGRVVLEAMVLGTPVVVPASAGPAEIVRDGVSGLTVEPGDARALAAGVVRMLAEPDLAASCVSGARERVCAQFSATAMANATLAVYGRILGG
jgi:glycosyltransferase involved in cell wall biosynthesis